MAQVEVIRVRSRGLSGSFDLSVTPVQPPEPLRVTVLLDMRGALLIVASAGTEACLPAVTAPFDVVSLRAAYREAGVYARVSEEIARGEISAIVKKRRNDARAERMQKGALDHANAALKLKTSADEIQVTKGALIEEKIAIDSEIRVLKGAIGRATSAAHCSGAYMDPEQFRGLERNLEDAKQRSQGVQAELGKLKSRQRGSSEEQARLAFLERFIAVVKDMLDSDEYEDVCAAAREGLADLPSARNADKIAIARETERFFVDVAKERLPEAQFRELFEEARRRWAEKDDGKR